MRYVVSALETPLREGPSDKAKIKTDLTRDTDIGEGIESEDRLWLKVDFGPRDDQKGFVLAADCKDQAGAPRRPIDPEAVVQSAVTTELRFNAADAIQSFQVLADFLI